ncbi:MAG: MFS transporter [Deltaproteobacteria bacterium]|nr:MFS transporter [Deltaproteobacteria bacterium]
MRGVRLLVLSVIWVCSFFLILDRVNISLAAPRIMDELKFDGTHMGLILSIYYWGYLLGHFGSGLVSDRVRLRRVTGWMIFIWSMLTALTGACTALWQFGVVRLLFGVSEGATANLNHKLQNNWLLPSERGRAYGIFIGCAYLGIAFGMPMVGWMISTWNWRVMFLMVGLLTLAMLALFVVVIRDHPHLHPWLSEEEKRDFQATLAQGRVELDAQGHDDSEIPLRERIAALASIRAFWFLCIASFFAIGVYFTAMSWLPGYLVKERGFTILNSGIYLIIPYLAAFAGMFFGGTLGDRFGNRSLIALITGILTFPALLGLAWSEGVFMTILMMSVALFLNSAAVNGIAVLVFDLIPAQVFGTAIGTVGGLAGGLGGVLGPLLLGYLYDRTGTFFWGFLVLGLSAVAGGLILLPVIGDERRVKQEKARQQATVAAPAVMEAASS